MVWFDCVISIILCHAAKSVRGKQIIIEDVELILLTEMGVLSWAFYALIRLTTEVHLFSTSFNSQHQR